MALSRVQYEQLVAGNKNFSVTVPYISKDDIKVSVAGEPVTFSWLNPQTVQLTLAPDVGQIIDIQRETERKNLLVDFQDASTITETQLDLASRQAFYLAQEAFDLTNSTMAVHEDGSYSASNRRISLMGEPDSDDDATTQGWVRAEFGAGYNAHTERELAEAAKVASQSAAGSSATSASQSAGYRDTGEQYKNAAAGYASAASTSETNAKTSETNAKTSETNAATYEQNAQSYAASINLPSAIGNALKLLRQKSDESGFEYFDISQLAELFSDVGDVKYRAGNVVPATWMEADGRLLSRSEYAELFAVIGTIYGYTNSSNFRLPDLRGEFLRGWDHGRGVDAGRELGSHQGDGLKDHFHLMATDSTGVDGTNSWRRRYQELTDYVDANSISPAWTPAINGDLAAYYETNHAWKGSSYVSLSGHPVDPSNTGKVSDAADENRPRNSAMLVLIKVKPGW